MGKARAIKAATAAALGLAVLAGTAAASELPTHRQLERATERFLDAHDPPPVPRAGSGGVGTGAKRVLPANRIVGLYGAPQMGKTALGRISAEKATAKLERRAAPYAELGGRPVVGAFDLVAVFATAGGGPDGFFRSRQSEDVIRIYLEQARSVGARLILDIQPGRAKIKKEMRALRDFLVEPDVDVAIDAEWNVGRRGVPGRTEGKLSARELNSASKWLSKLVAENALSPKLLLVHQFKKTSVRGKRKVKKRPGVQTVLSFDGIGSPRAKENGYASLSAPGLFNGFMVFERLDRPVMKPDAVLGLEPSPDIVLYQ